MSGQGNDLLLESAETAGEAGPLLHRWAAVVVALELAPYYGVYCKKITGTSATGVFIGRHDDVDPAEATTAALRVAAQLLERHASSFRPGGGESPQASELSGEISGGFRELS